jgi:glycosyltransferase involved in cell wall biosynthesis
LPVVATSIAAEGFDLVHAESAMIADSPDEFARAVVQVYTQEDLWMQLAENGRSRVTANFTPEVVEQVINAAIGN